MNELYYPINYDNSINRWWITDLQKKEFKSPYKTFEAPVNLEEDYVQVIYPVREAFLKENFIDGVKPYRSSYNRIYFPFESNRVDFTTFIHQPHHIWIYGETYLDIPEGKDYTFDLYTCGGVKLWVNNEDVLCFKPYSRNIPQKITLQLNLNKGRNHIEIYADELAERDVFFYFELRYKGDEELTGVLEVQEDPKEIQLAEAFLRSCYFNRDIFKEGKVRLYYEPDYVKKDIELYVEGDPYTAKLSNVEMNNDKRLTVLPGSSRVELGDVSEFNVGAFKVILKSKVGNLDIKRELLLGVMPEERVSLKAENTIEERKLQALRFISDHGENVVNRAMAILKTEKQLTPAALRCIESGLLMIENKEDCADFYLPPLLMLIKRYAPYIPLKLMKRIKESVINFRYWIDEPGNDVMWYFSENHALLFHISQYLSGYMYKDENFTVSNKTGLEQYAIGKERIVAWFDTFEKYGYAEWNSATYIPVDLIGFFILYELAPDAAVKERAIRALDFSFKIMALNSFNRVMGASYGRAYEETLKVRNQVEPNFCMWVAYGIGYLSSGSRAVTLFSLTDYVPPDLSCYLMLNHREPLTFQLDQGINRVKTYGYKTEDYFLASVRRFKPFAHGHQQHLMNLSLGKDAVQFFINHPGERAFSGGNRPSYWAGNGTIPFIEQNKNTCLMIYNIASEEPVHYIHGYTTFYDYHEYKCYEKWLFFRVDKAYGAVYFSQGYKITESGANMGKEIISKGLNHGIVIKAGSEKEHGAFERFMEELVEAEVIFDGSQSLSFKDPDYGKFLVEDVQKVTLDGMEHAYLPADYFLIEE